MTIRVLIADDHPLFRWAVRTALETVGGYAVVAEAADGEEAVAKAVEARPDVALLDLDMPGVGGADAARRIVASTTDVVVLMLTMYEDEDSLREAMRAGARGYLVKGSDEDAIVRAVAAAASGQAVFSPSVAGRLIRSFSAPRPAPAVPFPELTDREREVLALLAEGCDNATIARRLFVSTKTVRNHGSNVFTKLQVTTRSEAIVAARRAGMGEPGRGRPG